MKRIMVLLLVLMPLMLINCGLETGVEHIVEIKSSTGDESLIGLENKIGSALYVLVIWHEGNKSYVLEDRIDSLGGELGDMKIKVAKVIYVDGRPEQTVEFKLIRRTYYQLGSPDSEVLIEGFVGIGETEAILSWSW